MAWGKSKVPVPPPPPKSAIRTLLPLIVLFLFLAGLSYIGYQIYLTVTQISNAAADKMEKKNVVFTKDGVKVGVKEVKHEDYKDKTQSVLVSAWNLSSWPAYKSRLWNRQERSEAN